MHNDFKTGLQRKFSIIGLVIVLLLFIGLTWYVTSLFLEPTIIKEHSTEEIIETIHLEELSEEETEEIVLPVKKKEELLYVISREAKEITIINTTTDKSINRVSIPANAEFAFYNTLERRLYLSHPDEFSISVINVRNPTTIRKIELNERPGDLVVANNMIYVTLPEIDQVYVIDPLTEIVEKEIEIDSQPRRMTLSKDQRRIFVTNQRDETISAISTSINARVDTFKVGLEVIGVALNPTERYLYATNGLDNQITIVPLRYQKRMRNIGVGINPTAVAFSPNNLIALVTNEGGNTVSIVSISQERVLEEIEVGLAPTDVVITNDGKRAYVANKNDKTVSVIDIERKQRIKDIQVGDGPIALVLVER